MKKETTILEKKSTDSDYYEEWSSLGPYSALLSSCRVSSFQEDVCHLWANVSRSPTAFQLQKPELNTFQIGLAESHNLWKRSFAWFASESSIIASGFLPACLSDCPMIQARLSTATYLSCMSHNLISHPFLCSQNFLATAVNLLLTFFVMSLMNTDSGMFSRKSGKRSSSSFTIAALTSQTLAIARFHEIVPSFCKSVCIIWCGGLRPNLMPKGEKTHSL